MKVSAFYKKKRLIAHSVFFPVSFPYNQSASPKTTTFQVHVTVSGVKRPPFLRALKPAELGELRRRWGHVLSIGALGLRWGLHWGRARGLSVISVVVVGAAAGGLLCRRQPGLVGLLLSASLLLPQQLLSL